MSTFKTFCRGSGGLLQNFRRRVRKREITTFDGVEAWGGLFNADSDRKKYHLFAREYQIHRNTKSFWSRKLFYLKRRARKTTDLMQIFVELAPARKKSARAAHHLQHSDDFFEPCAPTVQTDCWTYQKRPIFVWAKNDYRARMACRASQTEVPQEMCA